MPTLCPRPSHAYAREARESLTDLSDRLLAHLDALPTDEEVDNDLLALDGLDMHRRFSSSF